MGYDPGDLDFPYALTLEGETFLEEHMLTVTDRNDPMIRFLDDTASGQVGGGFLLEGRRAKRLFEEALRKGYIAKDERSLVDIIGKISRYDRDLGKLLRIYHDTAKQKPVDNAELDEALMIAYERVGGYFKPEFEKDLQAIRGARGQKIATLDKWIQLLHRDYLLREQEHYGSPWKSQYTKDHDVGTILSRLSSE